MASVLRWRVKNYKCLHHTIHMDSDAFREAEKDEILKMTCDECADTVWVLSQYLEDGYDEI
jgi:hypothetical protein